MHGGIGVLPGTMNWKTMVWQVVTVHPQCGLA